MSLIDVSEPVSPVNDGSNRSRYLRITGPVSRAGSVVMNSIWTWSRTDLSSLVSADATSAITVGHTSGQLVYPKNTSVTGFLVEVTRLNGFPAVSVSVAAGNEYGWSSVAPRNPFGSCVVRMIAPPGLSAFSWLPPLQPARASRATAASRRAAFLVRLTAFLTIDGRARFPAYTFRQRFRELADAHRAAVLDRLDERRADNDRVRERCHPRRLVRVRDAQTDADRQTGHGLGPGDQRRRQVRRRLPGSRDTHHSGRVDGTTAGLGGQLDPLVGGRRRDQEHLVQVVLVRGGHPLRTLVRDQVGRDQARSPGGCEVGCEAVHAVPLDRVPVRHHEHRHVGVRRGLLDRAQYVAGPQSTGQRSLGGALDRDAVHHRVAVRQADLDHVDPAVDQRLDRVHATVVRREAGRQVADERSAAGIVGLPDRSTGAAQGNEFTHGRPPVRRSGRTR